MEVSYSTEAFVMTLWKISSIVFNRAQIVTDTTTFTFGCNITT